MGYVEDDKTAEQPLIAKPGPDVVAPTTAVEAEGKWSTGLCDCCAYPGGGALACKLRALDCKEAVRNNAYRRCATTRTTQACPCSCPAFSSECSLSNSHRYVLTVVSALISPSRIICKPYEQCITYVTWAHT
jgi:hypothetical protein